MARADGNHALEELRRVLMDAQFGYMPQGEVHIEAVFKVVKERHSELCDDSYLCSASCKRGTNSPEWKHVVRAVLNSIRHKGGHVSNGKSRGYWLFGNQESGPSIGEKEVIEGHRLLKLHKVKERKPEIVRCKKKVVLKATGRLLCEACDFDFAAFYGKIGVGVADCHHRAPLGDLDGEVPTRLEDLAIVCPNCHRILHRSRPMMKVEDLRLLIMQRRLER